MNMKNEIKSELINHIIPFWKGLIDTEQGGYYGGMDFDLHIQKYAVKGCILNSRILWFFSTACSVLHDQSLLPFATHAYEFMMKHCVDQEYGGVYWSLKADGTVEDSTKHTYNQAFAVYALSAYYQVTHKKEVLQNALQLYHIIEDKCRDTNGYGEAYTRQWRVEKNDKLSENGVMAERTMNTLLHVFEGYSGLYEVFPEKLVGNSIRLIADLFTEKIYNQKKRRQEVFFDRDYHTLIDLHSYGHDIETSWLLDWGCGLLKDQELSNKITLITDQLVREVYDRAFHNGYVYNECENNIQDKSCIWWIQAESVVGFINAWEKDKIGRAHV